MEYKYNIYIKELIIIILVLKIQRVYIENYIDLTTIIDYKNLIVFTIIKNQKEDKKDSQTYLENLNLR